MDCDVILNFHGVGTPGRALEPGEAPYWIDPDRFAAIVDLIRAVPAARVGITFDDGNASDLEICAPLLARHGLGARIFVLAGRIGAPGSLSAADLRALGGMGFGIGSHGHDHLDWRRLDGPGEVREFVTAREAIAAACGRPIADAAVPFGLYDRGVLARLRRHGYERVYTSDGGPVRGGPVRGGPVRVGAARGWAVGGRAAGGGAAGGEAAGGGAAGGGAAGQGFLVPRTSVRADMALDGIRDIILGREPPARRLRRRAAMLRKRLF